MIFMKTPARHRSAWAVTAGALTAAFGVAICCALPLALAIFGLGTATSLTMIGAWIAPYKGVVSLVAGMGIAAGFVLACRPCNNQCGDVDACAPPTNTWAMKAVLWVALILLIGGIVNRINICSNTCQSLCCGVTFAVSSRLSIA